MKEYTPLFTEIKRDPRVDGKGLWNTIPLSPKDSELVHEWIDKRTILPDQLAAFNKGKKHPFNPLGYERERRSVVPTLKELRDVLSPEKNETTVFEDSEIYERTNIIDSALSYGEAKTAQDKDLICTEVVMQMVEDPNYCTTFFHTLAEYEAANQVRFGRLFQSFSNKVMHTIEHSPRPIQIYNQTPKENQEIKLSTLLEISWKALPQAQEDSMPVWLKKGQKESAKAARKIIGALIKSTTTQEEIVNLMYNLVTGGLSLKQEEITHFVYTIISYGQTDIFSPTSPHAGRYAAATLALDDATFAKRTLLDYASTLLSHLYGEETGNLTNEDAAIRGNPEFDRCLNLNTELLMRTAGVNVSEADHIQQVNLEAKMKFLEESSRPNLSDAADTKELNPDFSDFTQKLAYPANLVLTPCKLRCVYTDLLSAHLQHMGIIEQPIILLALPDGTMRNVERKSGPPRKYAEQILRLAYTHGDGKELKDAYIVKDVLTYIHPFPFSRTPLKEPIPSIPKFTLLPSTNPVEHYVRVDIGKYNFKIKVGPGGLYYPDGTPIDTTTLPDWITSIESFVAQQLIGTEQATLNNKQLINIALESVAPPLCSQKTEILHQTYLETLNSEQIAYGFSAGGDTVNFKTRHQTQIARASSITFNWGDNAAINVTLHIGQCIIPLCLDIHYHLTHRDGSLLEMDPNTLLFWETLISSQLVRLFSKNDDIVSSHGGQEKGTETKQRRPPKAHRVILQAGHRPTIQQSIATANSPYIRLRVFLNDVDVAMVRPQDLLIEYNKLCPRPDGRLYTFALPKHEGLIDYTPVQHSFRNSLDELRDALSD